MIHGTLVRLPDKTPQDKTNPNPNPSFFLFFFALGGFVCTPFSPTSTVTMGMLLFSKIENKSLKIYHLGLICKK